MKPYFLFLSAGAAVMALSACSPSTPASDASASVSESPTATVAADDTTADTTEAVVTESVASSAATVVVTQAETYDPVAIRQMGEKPGYWEVKHTDPKTNKSYVTHVCVDKPLAAKMTKQGPVSAPADRRDYKDDANFKGECPSGVQGGDVQKSDGNKVNAYGDHKPQAVDHSRDQTPAKNTDNKAPDSKDHKDQPTSKAAPGASHNPHTTPAEDHANDKPDSNARPDDHRN
jgi:hypothetical protein